MKNLLLIFLTILELKNKCFLNVNKIIEKIINLNLDIYRTSRMYIWLKYFIHVCVLKKNI